MRAVPALLCAAALALSVGACTDPNSIAAQANSGDQKGYISGNGTIEHIPAGKRAEPIELSGITLRGESWSSESARGKVVVINKWASWCPPCEEELPELKAAWEHFDQSGDPVVFMGIDFREAPENGLALVKSEGIPYPSLSDESGTLVLALQGKATATPTTLVLDPKGRIAARVAGQVTESTLVGLVDDVLAES